MPAAERRPLRRHPRRHGVGRHRPHRHVHRDAASPSRPARSSTADIIVTATGLQLVTLGEMDFVVDGEPVDFATDLHLQGPRLLRRARTWRRRSATSTRRGRCAPTSRASTSAACSNHMAETGTTVARPGCARRTRACRSARGSTTSPPATCSGSMHLLPKQGDREPWIHPQNYTRDKKLFRKEPVDDGVMRFTGRPAGGGDGAVVHRLTRPTCSASAARCGRTRRGRGRCSPTPCTVTSSCRCTPRGARPWRATRPSTACRRLGRSRRGPTQAPPWFRFVFKLPRTITHDLRLRDAGHELSSFLDRIDPLGERAEQLSIQLPRLVRPGATSARWPRSSVACPRRTASPSSCATARSTKTRRWSPSSSASSAAPAWSGS